RTRPIGYGPRTRWWMDQGLLVHLVRRSHCEAAGVVTTQRAGSPPAANEFRVTSRVHRGLFAVLVLALSPRPIVGQEPAAPYRVTWFDAVSVGTAGALYVLPAALGLPKGAPSCAPCDPASLPGVDRWALRRVSATAGTA